jgi:predicted  nucleic acid-binding Zn-ribbon protein
LRRSSEEKHRLELEHSSLQKDLSLLKSELSRITAEKKALCDEVKKLESSKSSAEQQLNLREQQCVDLEENVRKLKDELSSASNQLHTERLAFELDKAALNRNVSEMQNELDEVKRVKVESVEKCTKLEVNVVSLTNELQILNSKLRDDFLAFEAEKQLQINSISRLQDELQNRLAELENLTCEKLEMDQKCLKFEDTVEQLTTEIECMNERLSQERLSFEAEKLSQQDVILKLQDELKVTRVTLEKVELDKTIVGEKCAVLEGVVSNLTEEVESVRMKLQEERVALTTENEAK